MTHASDRELGLHKPITRRDFVYGSAAVVGGAWGCRNGREPDGGTGGYDFAVDETWFGPGGVGEYRTSHGNTPELVGAAHRVRAGEFLSNSVDAHDTGETFDVVIVGGGIAGLSAAHHFRRLHPVGRALLLDNHPIAGGEAKRNDFLVEGEMVSGPQGSNDMGIPPATGEPDDYFTALGIPRDLTYVEARGSASELAIPLDNYSFLHWQHEQFSVGNYFESNGGGRWVKDVWSEGLASTGWSADVRDGFRRVRATTADGRRPAGELGPWLDSMTMRDYYLDVLGAPEEVVSYVDPILASIIGLGCDAISAWWGYHFELPGFRDLTRYANLEFHSFPGGNAGIARHFLNSIVPGSIAASGEFEDVIFGTVDRDRLDRPDQTVRVRTGATVVHVAHTGQDTARRAVVTYLSGGRLYRTAARAVVMASGGWINRHVLRDLPDGHRIAYDAFRHAPVLVANVALTNWRFLERLGIAACIWSGGFGFSCNIRRPMRVGRRAQPLDPDRPIVLTFYVPFYYPTRDARQQGAVGRAELLSTSFADYERDIREQMVRLFAAGGFDPARDIAGIILNRWGHAYVTPGPGFMFGAPDAPAPPDVVRQPFERVAIGHSELRGHQNWTGAAAEGRRAVETVLDLHL